LTGLAHSGHNRPGRNIVFAWTQGQKAWTYHRLGAPTVAPAGTTRKTIT
jgi:hypothetical protein